MPEVRPMLATDGSLLLQVPPAMLLLRVAVRPAHKDVVPLIVPVANTVTLLTARQPLVFVKVIFTVPPATPVTMPLAASTVAVAVLPELQVPEAELESDIVVPAHKEETPDIAAGAAFTVTETMRLQPVARVYVMSATPADTPDTLPVVLVTVAMLVLLLAQVPPPVAVRAVVAPSHTLVVPLMAPGNGLTVTVIVLRQPPGSV